MKRVEGLALVGEMAAGIAHEIRNPMASISGSIEVLKEGNDWDGTQKTTDGNRVQRNRSPESIDQRFF